jgi:NAD(P)-dependent dehydrogenase (short-subunit alcohol dehydrogenase family)
VYPAIDPQPVFEAKEYDGKVVLVAGASRGIGQTIAFFYAKAGATVALVARSSVEETKTMILKAAPDTKLLEFVADVTDSDRAEEVVRAIVAKFGKLDILVANAASGNGFAKRSSHPSACA